MSFFTAHEQTRLSFSHFLSLFFYFLSKCNPRTNFVTQSKLWAIGLTSTRLSDEQTLSVDEQTRV